ncbi:hypothetical protein DPMN_039831 [Dreissena polymorpha]|uniref:Uncharacterized protein n=1 Tax=Dreissena polymorpha TaxID=45954 RepID=A0A9D4HUM3_DREPO|nr:hypothetical protein DPMN_039831 [Dreissena polymorpha]
MPPIRAVSCSGSQCVWGGEGVWVGVAVGLGVGWMGVGVEMGGVGVGVCGWVVVVLVYGNHFTVLSHRDFDLCPSDLNINRGHLRVMTNVPMMFREPRPRRS